MLNAEDSDEQDWLEWKSEIDLRSKAQIADKIAKHVIAMANRDPSEALLRVGGIGIIVLGMEPGNVVGVSSVDNADLDKLVTAYLGVDGPVWRPYWDRCQSKSVLIIEVEPPQQGDMIHAFRKEIGRFLDGSVYVRRKAHSEPATSADLRRLAARFAAHTPPELALSVVVENQDGLRRCDDGFEHRDRYLSAERRRLTAHGIDDTQLGTDESVRYDAEVETYLDSIRNAWPSVLEEAASFVLDPAVFVVENRSAKHLTDVVIEIELEGVVGAVLAQDDALDWSLADVLPRKMKSLRDVLRKVDSVTILGASHVQNWNPSIDYGPDTSIEMMESGSLRLVFPDVDVRLNRTCELESQLVIMVVGGSGPVVARWAATASNVHAEASGEFILSVGGPPVDVISAANDAKAKAVHDRD